MSEQHLGLLIGLFVAGGFVAWAWRRFDVRAMSVTYDSAPADEPCWTEEVRGADGLSYGRYGCHHSQLKEIEARVRMGEFTTPH